MVIEPIIGKSETWLSDYNVDLYNINEYNLVENHIKFRTGGGASFFLQSITAYQIRHELCSIIDTYESVFIELDKDVFHKTGNIVVGMIYRPPNTVHIQFSDNLGDLLEKLRLETKCCYFLGDYNVKMLKLR